MLLIGVTLVLLAAWYVFVTVMDRGPLAMRALLAATGCTGQIAVTCTLLGAIGLLTRGIVIGANVALAAALVAAALRVLGNPRQDPRSRSGEHPLDPASAGSDREGRAAHGAAGRRRPGAAVPGHGSVSIE